MTTTTPSTPVPIRASAQMPLLWGRSNNYSMASPPNPALSSWAGQYSAPPITPDGWGTYFFPLVVHANGSIDIAGSPLPLSNYDSQNAIATFTSVPIKETVASGQITFLNTNGQRTFSATITPLPGEPEVTLTGNLNVAFAQASMQNLVPANPLLVMYPSVCYISASNGNWLAIDSESKAVTASSSVPYGAQPFDIAPAGGGGFYLTVGGRNPIVVEDGALYSASGDAGTVFHAYASVSGHAVIGDGQGGYWSLASDSDAMVLDENPEQLAAPLLLNIVIQHEHMHTARGLQGDGAAVAAPEITLSDCDWAVASLVWQVTGGLFLALGIGPFVSSGAVSTGVYGLIKSSTLGRTALATLVDTAKENPTAMVGAAATFLGALYHADLLWPLVKVILTQLGWLLLLEVLAKILEVCLLEEVEVAEVLASFAVWSVQTAHIATDVRSACK